jgi:cytochrome c-type biogenesis protein CcmH/NrfG
MRRSAKWAFAFLAVIFAGTFAFLGVGSGNSGLGDLLNGHLFGGSSSTPSIKDLQKKVAKNPKDASAYLQLGQALDEKGRTSDAIGAYRHYTVLRPRNVDGWNQLATEYLKKAREQNTALQNVAATASPLVDPTEFSPGGKLGQGLAGYADPLHESLTSSATARQAQLQPQLQATLHELVGAYKRAAALQPDDPTVQYQVAQIAEETGDLTTALAAYQRFVKRFPDDNFAPEAKKQIKLIKRQLHGTPQVSSSSSR